MTRVPLSELVVGRRKVMLHGAVRVHRLVQGPLLEGEEIPRGHAEISFSFGSMRRSTDPEPSPLPPLTMRVSWIRSALATVEVEGRHEEHQVLGLLGRGAAPEVAAAWADQGLRVSTEALGGSGRWFRGFRGRRQVPASVGLAFGDWALGGLVRRLRLVSPCLGGLGHEGTGLGGGEIGIEGLEVLFAQIGLRTSTARMVRITSVLARCSWSCCRRASRGWGCP